MATKSMQRIILTLSFAESMALTVAKWYEDHGKKSKEVEKLCRDIQTASDRAVPLYPRIPDRDIAMLEVKIRALQAFINGVQGADVVTGLSLLLGQLDQVMEETDNGKKTAMWDGLHKPIARLLRYFDRNFDKSELYAKATKALDFYEELLGCKAEDIVIHPNNLYVAHVQLKGRSVSVRLPRMESRRCA